MNVKRIMEILSKINKLNLYKRYKMYKDLTKTLSSNNTMDICKFMEMDSDKRDLTLFSILSLNKLKIDTLAKLSYLIIMILCGSTGVSMII